MTADFSSGGSGGAPSGAAGGVLGGTYPNPAFAASPLLVSYVEFTSTVLITATVEASSDLLVTAGAFTPNGSTPYWIEFSCNNIFAPGSGKFTNVCLFDNGVSLGQLTQVGLTGGVPATPAYAKKRVTPTAVAHTYSIRAFNTSAGTASAQADVGGAGKVVPGYICIARAL